MIIQKDLRLPILALMLATIIEGRAAASADLAADVRSDEPLLRSCISCNGQTVFLDLERNELWIGESSPRLFQNVAPKQLLIADHFGDQRSARESAGRQRPPSKSKERMLEERRQSEDVNDIFKAIRQHNLSMSSFIESPRSGVEDSRQRLKLFRAEMDKAITPEIVNAAKDASSHPMARTIRRAEAWIGGMETSLSGLKQELASPDQSARSRLLTQVKILHSQEKLKYMLRLFPDSENARSAHVKAKELVAQVGSIDSLLQQENAEQRSKIASARLPSAVKKDPALERAFARAFETSSFVQREFPGSQVLRVHLTSRNWRVTRNELTGIILSRQQQADLAIKTPGGKCYWAMEIFEQKHLGKSQYGRAYLVTGVEQELLCDNIPD